MKKDNMLNESTIRRFMKLATIDGLTDKFVAENLEEVNDDVEEGMRRAKRDDEELEEGAEETVEEANEETVEEATEETVEESTDELDEMGEMPMDRDEEEGEMEMDLGMDAEEPAAEAGGMVSVDQLMSALEAALEDVLGQEVEVSQDGEEEMDMDADAEMDMDADAEMDMDADAEMDMDAEEEEEELEEVNDDVIEEVFARVIQRLTKETKSNKK